MKLEIKTFNELSSQELYKILRLRSEVFVIEQDCAYQDLDNNDQQAIHVLGVEDGVIVAYARCFEPGAYFDEASIGRVLVRKEYRRLGYGHKLIKAAINVLEAKKADRIKIAAQAYLIFFYQSHGFQTIGDRYSEDGIPHIAMMRVG